MVSTTPSPQLPFNRLGDYDVLAPISEGGMASVWLGRERQGSQRLVALKVIRLEHSRNKEFIAMFVDEARIASRLSHPNIIALHGLGHDGRRHFLVMEVLRGRTLLAAWERAHEMGRRLGYELVAWIGARVADALHYAHEMRDEKGAPQEIVHRDVSPSNVFLTSEGVPKLIDFGLAKARDRMASTAFGVLKGKLAYLAPEQAHGKPADRRADVFALGVTLWELSLDRRLFREDSDVETVKRVREANVPDPKTIMEDYPPVLAAAIARALERDPEQRYQTAAEMRDALDAYVHDSGAEVATEGVRALLGSLFGDAPSATWEDIVDEAAVGPERIRVWDDDRQKLTWMNAAIETLAPPTRTNGTGVPKTHGAAAAARETGKTRRERLDAALAERLAAVDERADRVGVARAHLERAIVEELLGDPAKAAEHARRSIGVAPTAEAHAMLRRVEHARGAAKALLEHLEAEAADCPPGPARADLLAERARLLTESGAPQSMQREAWQSVLDAQPAHAAALRGLEASLAGDPKAAADLAKHLGTMAEASIDDPTLAAWLHVERARLLDRAQGEPDAAKAALLRAMELDRRVGPVRAACVAHAAVHRDAAWTVALFAEEASLESDQARAARLELDAAMQARHRLGDTEGAITLLERAAARVAVAPAVRRRALEELATLYEVAGRTDQVLRVRRARLTLVEDARARAHENRALGLLEEGTGNAVAAIAGLERALELAPGDATVAHDLDRLLEGARLTGRRVELWTRLAAVAPPGADRARALLRAARLAQGEQDIPRAVELVRAALVAHPASIDALDRLLRLVSMPPQEGAAASAQARIAVHAHGAEHAPDPARRIAHLEAIALLQEEALGDAMAAAATYETVLRLEPGRRGAIVGLARAAALAGDAVRLARSLLEEAAATSDATMADALRVRAAETLPPLEAERALAIVREVLGRTPAHAEARRIEQRLHEAGERWARVDETLRARLDHAADDRTKVDLWMARAELQRTKLRAPKAALQSLREALTIDPAHPGAREALVRELAAEGDVAVVRDALVELAAAASTADEQIALLSRAADLCELEMLDDANAAAIYAKAIEQAPDDDWLAERQVRLMRRRARAEGQEAKGAAVRDLRAALASRLDRAPASPERAFDLALALLDDGGDVERATKLVESVLSTEPTAPHALRTLERIGRASGSAPLLANALAQQAESFTADTAVLGALWAEAQMVEWTLPGSGDSTSLVEGILRRAPADRAALDAALRQSIPLARAGDADARARVVASLRARLQVAANDGEKLWAHLATALTLEPEDAPRADEGTRAALAAYREAQRVDPRSVVAAAGARRLGAALGDAEAVVAADIAQADLASDPVRRATILVHAAGQTLSTQDERLGTRPEKLARAADMLERALEADPESLSALGLLVAVRAEDGSARDVLLAVLRRAFERSKTASVVTCLGAEVARVASIEPADRLLAIEALRRVLAVAPGHPPTLQALAEQHVAQQAWGDAVETLEQLAANARDSRTRLAALFQAADLYAATLARLLDAERVLRTALDIDPSSVDALRKLLASRRAAGAPARESMALIERLAEAETAPEPKGEALAELASLRRDAGDAPGAEKALVQAAALAPTPTRITALLELHAGAPADQARSLTAVVTLTQEAERPNPLCVATLGRLEIESLGHWRDGIAHLRVALALAPGMHEVRASLAKGLVHMRGSAEAVGLLSPMIAPDPSPLLSLEDPAAAIESLERALADEGRADEAMVARELRAVAGDLDDGSHVALRARRQKIDPLAPVPIALDPGTLRSAVVPKDAPSMLLDVAAALSGVEGKLARVELEELGASPRSRLQAGVAGQPLLVLVARVATMLGLPRIEVVVGDVKRPRVLGHDPTWLVVPESILSQQEPLQTALVVGPLVRAVLGASWLYDLPGPYAHATLCGAIRQVVSGYAADAGDADQQDLAEEMSRRVAKAIGRKQKKALQELAAALEIAPEITPADGRSFELAVARTELRAAFVVTGDLLATLDVARGDDAALGTATGSVGRAALAAMLRHPSAGDLAGFALAPSTTALRWRAGTLGGKRASI
jgi:tetratricopeptide (TPR) repeat protein